MASVFCRYPLDNPMIQVQAKGTEVDEYVM